MGGVVGEPRAALRHGVLEQRVRGARRVDAAGDGIPRHEVGQQHARHGIQHRCEKRRHDPETARAFGHGARRLELQPGGAVHDQHRDRNQAGEQGIRVEQPEERAVVEDLHVVLDAKRHALQHVAHRHAEDQCGYEAAYEQGPVPSAAPCRFLALAAELEGHRPQDQRDEDREHRQVETRERHRVELRPRREDRAAAEDQPHLVAFPDRADGVDDDTALDVAACHERQQRSGAQIETIGEGKADQQHPQQRPPDQAQDIVGDQFVQDHVRFSLGCYCAGARSAEAAGRPSTRAGAWSSGPLRIALSISFISMTSRTV